jgi:hypothetical protein
MVRDATTNRFSAATMLKKLSHKHYFTRQTLKHDANPKQTPEHSCLEDLRIQNIHYNNQKKTQKCH